MQGKTLKREIYFFIREFAHDAYKWLHEEYAFPEG